MRTLNVQERSSFRDRDLGCFISNAEHVGVQPAIAGRRSRVGPKSWSRSQRAGRFHV